MCDIHHVTTTDLSDAISYSERHSGKEIFQYSLGTRASMTLCFLRATADLSSSRSMVLLLSQGSGRFIWPPLHKLKEQVPKNEAGGLKMLTDYTHVLPFALVHNAS